MKHIDRFLCLLTTGHWPRRWSRSQGNTRVCKACGHRWRDRT
jgi:hypothetical protein